MNKELELEAEKYAWQKKNPFSKELSTTELVLASKTDFIAGATSKYVEKQKLEFAIEQLNKIQVNVFAAFAEYEVAKSCSKMLSSQIKELEQKLSEL